jgi:hypothetical protein
MQLRLARFDRPGPGSADNLDRALRVHARLDEQACGDCASAAEPAATVDQDRAAALQDSQFGTGSDPTCFELQVRHRNVADRQMNPLHPVPRDGLGIDAT